jgi:exonuclease SbcD
MSLRILATSDIHIGLKFTGYPDVQDKLIEARFKVLEKLVGIANNKTVDLFIIAGDLFHQVSVTKKEVLRARQILGEFQGKLLAVLPGNHDFLTSSETDIWKRFDQDDSGNVLVLRKNEPYPLEDKYGIDACLYPGPCISKHSSKNMVGWIKETQRVDNINFLIGVAHGSLEGVSPDFDNSYYPMKRKELKDLPMDCWVLGHTHISWNEGNMFYPGTPEPDGFDCSHKGSALLIELENGTSPLAEQIECGAFRFEHVHETISRAQDIKCLEAKICTPEYSNCLLKVNLSGRLSREDYSLIEELRKRIEKAVFFLHSFSSQVSKEIRPTDIDAEFTQDSFPHRLLTELGEDEGDSEALQVAYELIKGMRK